MGEATLENRQTELRTKRICRFCMTQNDPLSHIYSRENRLKSSAPLPLQIMACVSIEVFSNDGMPSTICDNCRMLMEHCYRFKQMCKKSDTALRQYPLTGTWPNAFEIPKMPEELVQIHYPKILNPGAKYSSTTSKQLTTSPEKPKLRSSKVILNEVALKPIKPKILNKTSMKILNKDAQISNEAILSNPIIKQKESGGIEIVTEIFENSEIQSSSSEKNVVPIVTNVFPCPHCERSFPLRQLLDIHLVNHNRERCFECSVCQKRFFSKYDLGKHNLIHTGEKPFECVVCKKAFTRSTLLHRHEKIHTDIPKFLCVYCDKPFLSKDELAKHTERHKKNRPFSCKICGKSFAFKQGLERHEIVHAKEQPFPCQYCDQSFPTPSKLSRHLTAHAGSRPFPCKLCPKSYLLSHHLTRHLRSHKEGSGSYKCYDCEKTFTTRDDLIYHSAVHATQTLVCPLCKEHFDDLDLVTEHIRLHAEGEQYACEFCDLIFMTAEKLTSHSDAEHSADLAVYEEHTRNNIKKDLNDEEGEILQEFIIEEYAQDIDDDQFIDLETKTFVKQEELIAEKLILKKRPKSTYKESKQTDDVLEHHNEKETDNTLEMESFFEINEFIDDKKEEPIIKKQKTEQTTTENCQLSLKLEKDEVNQDSSILSVLKQIPKSVTIAKKNKAPSEVRVLNEKIIISPDVLKKGNSEKLLKTDETKISSQQKMATRQDKPTTTKTPKNLIDKQSKKVVEMVIGDKKVKVHKITMTKAEAQKMAKQGRIKMENGAMILKQKSTKIPRSS